MVIEPRADRAEGREVLNEEEEHERNGGGCDNLGESGHCVPFRLECERGGGNTPPPRGPPSLGGRGRKVSRLHHDAPHEVGILPVLPQCAELPGGFVFARFSVAPCHANGILSADVRGERGDDLGGLARVLTAELNDDALTLNTNRNFADNIPCLAEPVPLKEGVLIGL